MLAKSVAFFKDLKKIYNNNTFHARIVITILYLEIFNRYTSVIFKVLRKIINQAIYHCEIYPSSVSKEVLTTLELPHPYSIIIHGSCRIGRYNTILQEVTIGVNKVGDDKEKAARLGDNVFVGAKSMIIGSVLIEDKAKIGAGARIFRDVSLGEVVKYKKTRFLLGAHAFIINKGRVLIMKRARDDDCFPNKWDLPGGTIQAGESLEEGLKREVFEESDLNIVPKRIVYNFTRNDDLPEYQYHSFVYLCSSKSLYIKLNEEHSKYRWVKIGWLKKQDSKYFVPYLSSYIKKIRHR